MFKTISLVCVCMVSLCGCVPHFEDLPPEQQDSSTVDSLLPDVPIASDEDADRSVQDVGVIPIDTAGDDVQDTGSLQFREAGNSDADSGQISVEDAGLHGLEEAGNQEIAEVGTPVEEVGTPALDVGLPLPIQCVLNRDCPGLQYCDEVLNVCVWNPEVIKCKFVCPNSDYDYAAVYAAGERENIECQNGTFERMKNNICLNGHPEFRFILCDRFGGGPRDEICEHGELAVVLCNNPNYNIEPDHGNAQAGMQIVVFEDDC